MTARIAAQLAVLTLALLGACAHAAPHPAEAPRAADRFASPAGAASASAIPVFDVGLQAHDPAGGFDFASVVEGTDFGMHTRSRYGDAAPAADELLRRTLAEMDRGGIRMGLLGGGPLVRQWQAADPERFLLSYEPNLRLEDHTAAVAEFAAGVRDGTYRALGELALVYGGIPFNAPVLFPYYEVAQEHGIPVFIHTGFSGPNPQQMISPAFRIGVADPLLLEEVLIRFPDMKVVMMHMGWPFFDHALYMLATYPNVHMETSVAVWTLGPQLFHRLLREAVATVGSDRILFGSLQMVWPEVIGRSVSAVREADYLTDEDRHNILWRNAARLLRVDNGRFGASDLPGQPGTSPPTADTIPSYADTGELRRYAQAIVDEFGAQAAAAGFDLGPAPVIEVRTTPVLIYYSGSRAAIGVPWWEALPDAQRAMFTLFGGDEAEGERIFRAFFNRFLVAHEAGHWFQARTDTRQPTLYENENMANRIAVAFWRTQPDAEAFLAELERMLVGIVDRVPDPTPPGEDPVAFFGANYRALAEDGVGYGYFQFRFMRDAIRDRAQLSLADMVAAAGLQ